ncbi:peptidoglycan-binding protein [Streptomyces sp. NPDC001941]|uniref:peptidoglycan-binding protein n=1 Tax=Streptomyces sp. NPDC001941 TaxID=3154659 RepID=UPI00331E2104
MPDEEAAGSGGARRGRLLAVVVAVAVVLCAGGIGAAAFVESPAQKAASHAPPAPDVLTAPVEKRVLRNSVVLRGTVAAARTTKVTPLPGAQGAVRAVVTRTPLAPGAAVRAGAVLVEVSGRPLLALEGTLPVYRDLRPGARGQDVRQLQAALAKLGYGSGDDAAGVFGAATQRALTALYADRGYEPLPARPEGADEVTGARQAVTQARRAWEDAPEGKARRRAAEDLAAAREALDRAEAADGPMLPAAEAVFLSGFPARVDRLAAAVGEEAKGELLTVSAGALVVNGTLDRDRAGLVRAGQAVELLSEATGASATGTVASVARAPAGQGGQDTGADAGAADGTDPGAGAAGGYLVRVVPSRPLPAELAGQDVRLTVTAATSRGPVLVVPLSAVYAGADGRTRVTVYGSGGARREVEIATDLTGDGSVAVRPLGGAALRAGDQVIVGVRGAGG